MTLYGWHNCPAAVQQQLQQFIGEVEAELAGNLVGVYLHGSLAMGSFNPDRSDLDILVVTQRHMDLETKRRMGGRLLKWSEQPQPIEISFLSRSHLIPWQHPAPFDLHYSEMWRSDYERDLMASTSAAWRDSQRRDPDLAAHITITTHRGICLAGAAIAEVFPTVPRPDYIDAIMGDVYEGLENISKNPIYGILNACRTYAYLRDGHIYSKAEGGLWALRVVPEPLHPPVALALAAYQGEPEVQPLERGMFDEFAAYMYNVLSKLTAG